MEFLNCGGPPGRLCVQEVELACLTYVGGEGGSALLETHVVLKVLVLFQRSQLASRISDILVYVYIGISKK